MRGECTAKSPAAPRQQSSEAAEETPSDVEKPPPPPAKADTSAFRAGGPSSAGAGASCAADAECAAGLTCFDFHCTDIAVAKEVRNVRASSAREAGRAVAIGAFFSVAAPVSPFKYTPVGGAERRISRAPMAAGLEVGLAGGTMIRLGYAEMEPEPGVKVTAFHVRMGLAYPIVVYRGGTGGLTRLLVSPGIDLLGMDIGISRNDTFVSTALKVDATLLWRTFYVTLAPATIEAFYLYDPPDGEGPKSTENKAVFGFGLNYVFRVSAGVAF